MEFLKENYFILLHAAAIIVALLKYRLYFDSILSFFPVLLAYALFSELLGLFMTGSQSFQTVFSEKNAISNNVIFSIYDIVFFFFFFYVFYRILKRPKYKVFIKYGAIAYLLSSIINPLLQDFLILPQILAYTLGSIILIGCILLYFKERAEGLQEKNQLMNWICFGVLIFNSIFPILLILVFFNSEWFEKPSLKQLHHFLIATLYGCFIIGFLKMRRMKAIEKVEI